MSRVLIGLGANLGNREDAMRRAIASIAALPGTRIVAKSALHESPAIGGSRNQPVFLNAAITIETEIPSRDLLQSLQRIESALGRTRTDRWAPRSIDLDILLYDELVAHEPDLIVPHPRLVFRRFALAPATEVAGNWLCPTTGWTISQHLRHLNEAANYLALTGGEGASRRRVAAWAASEAGVALVTSSHDDAFSSAPADDESFQRWLAEWTGALDQVATQLRAGAVISDFWAEPARSWGEAFATDRQLAANESAFSQRPVVAQPKLVVVLQSGDQLAVAAEAHLCAVLDRAARNGDFPVYPLAVMDETDAVMEVAAAVLAMQ